jgi:hypothetical protein
MIRFDSIQVCTALHGGRCVLIGDAGAPFPPVGQGVNAAMEGRSGFHECAAPQRAAERPVRDPTHALHRTAHTHARIARTPVATSGDAVRSAAAGATVLDRLIGEHLGVAVPSAEQRSAVLHAVTSEFTRVWQPEAIAMRAIAQVGRAVLVLTGPQGTHVAFTGAVAWREKAPVVPPEYLIVATGLVFIRLGPGRRQSPSGAASSAS